MQEKIIRLLKEHSEERYRPDDSPYTAIDLKHECAISRTTGTSLYEIEELALAAGITPTRYSRNQLTLSITDQQQLHLAHIAVIGLGGLGGGVTELLARIGIGNLILIDGDSFDESNLNRQLLSSVANIGVAKATVAGSRVQDINPAIRAQTHIQFLTAASGHKLLGKAIIAIDCLDTIPDRFILEQICKKKNIPMISGAIAGKMGQLTVVFPQDKGLLNLYGSAENAPDKGVESSLGTLAFTAAHMAALQCAEAVNLILKKESLLRNGFLFNDLSDYSSEHIKTS